MSNVLRNLPSVNELLDSPPLKDLIRQANRNVVVSGVRDFLENFRSDVQAAADIHIPKAGELAEKIAAWIVQEERLPLQPVVNATGVLLHTGLGRAPLADVAIDAIAQIARGYASLEVETESGQRSQRVQAVERLLKKLTGAEAAAIVNNNAAATLLTLAAVAGSGEVIVSRGQLIEIGGSYRLPDVMAASGARLREVGTTNKTRIEDYEQAIGDETTALLRVHTSNYVVVGFTASATLPELVELGRRKGLPVIDDIGSGALVDFAPHGIHDEPVVQQCIQHGADLVLFSGDKLLGGPQCGIILGSKKWIAQINRHPLMRAFRVDKMTLAALAATLQLYQDPQKAYREIPLLTLLSTSEDNLRNRSERLAPQIADCPAVQRAEPVRDTSFLGGGAVPTQEIPTWCVSIETAEGSVDTLARRLRAGQPSVFGRVQKDRLLLDLRSVFPRQDQQLVQTVQAVTNGQREPTHPAELT